MKYSSLPQVNDSVPQINCLHVESTPSVAVLPSKLLLRSDTSDQGLCLCPVFSIWKEHTERKCWYVEKGLNQEHPCNVFLL